MNTKIFCDIADIKFIRKFSRKKIVKGFTTNPSLMRLAGAKNYQKYSKEILKICKKPISFEVFGDDYNSMRRQALIINSWGKNVYVKIPVINSKGIFMGKIIRELNKKNIVKVYTDNKLSSASVSKAITFSRENLLNYNSNIYHHIGIYMYKVSILKKFVNLKQTKSEIDQKLEQLRAIDNKILINVILANTYPIGVDTEEDFVELKKIMNYKN